MPYLTKERAARVAKRTANPLLDTVLAISVAMLCCLVLLATPLAVADEVMPEEPQQGHTCGDPASWVDWERLIAKNPNHTDLRALYALRVGLCIHVQQGKLTVDQGTAIFERARRTLIQQIEMPTPGARSKL